MGGPEGCWRGAGRSTPIHSWRRLPLPPDRDRIYCLITGCLITVFSLAGSHLEGSDR